MNTQTFMRLSILEIFFSDGEGVQLPMRLEWRLCRDDEAIFTGICFNGSAQKVKSFFHADDADTCFGSFFCDRPDAIFSKQNRHAK